MSLTHYEVLGVERSATTEVIERAYRDRIATGPDPIEEALTEGGSTRVDEAFAVLSDPRLRAAYDAALQQEAATTRAVHDALMQARVSWAPEPERNHRDLPEIRGGIRSLVLLWLLSGLGFTASVVWGAPAWAVAGSLVLGWVGVVVLATVAILRVATGSAAAVAGYAVALAAVVGTGIRFAGSVSPVSLALLGTFVALYVLATELSAWQSRGDVRRPQGVREPVFQD